MRGTGKTHIGSLAASILGWEFVDADAYFEEKLKIGIKSFVAEKGWDAFRQAELDVLRDLIAEKSSGHIISLGGGIVETSAARNLLKAYKGPVVHVVRPIDEIVAYLDSEDARPAYGEPIGEVFRRREAWYEECSRYLFDNQFDVEDEASAKKASTREVKRFFQHISGQRPNLAANLVQGRHSYFLSLTYPDLTQALPHIEELTEGVDALELRADLLRSQKDYESIGQVIPSASYVRSQIAVLRRVTSLPIVFTVRTKSQGGAFPDTAVQEAADLLGLALRMGVEYVDVEITLPDGVLKSLSTSQGYSHIIASYHDWTGALKWDGPVVKEKYEVAAMRGDIVKIVGKATSLKDNFALYDFVSEIRARPGSKPVIAVNMGVEGQMSRILNSTFSPVSHPLLPNKAAPGQLSFREIQQALHLIGLSQSQRFYLFGTPISQSMSPTLHNTAFSRLGLPHQYQLLETKDIGDEIKIAITSPDFGGASVTIPYKLDVIPLLDKLTLAAEAIGAVNTIIPQATGPDGSKKILVGDNTDWLGIKRSIVGQLGSRPIRTSLVIGAGGTARAAIYALHSLDAGTIYLYNRTKGKAEDLSKAFPEAKVVVLDSLTGWEENKAPSVIVSTIPASATTTDLGMDSTKVVALTSDLFAYHGGAAVVIDMAYRPAETPLLKLAKENGTNWKIVPGLEVLLEQGYEQFRLWTGRACPQTAVSKVVWAKYEQLT